MGDQAQRVQRRLIAGDTPQHGATPAGLEPFQVVARFRAWLGHVVDDDEQPARRDAIGEGADALVRVRAVRQRFDRDHEIERPHWRIVVALHEHVDTRGQSGPLSGSPCLLRLRRAQRQAHSGATEAAGEVEHHTAQPAPGVEDAQGRLPRHTALHKGDEHIVESRRCGPSARQRISQRSMHRQHRPSAAVPDKRSDLRPPRQAIVVRPNLRIG